MTALWVGCELPGSVTTNAVRPGLLSTEIVPSWISRSSAAASIKWAAIARTFSRSFAAEIRAALDFLQARGREHGIAGRAVLSGWSAGGHLAALTAGRLLSSPALGNSGSGCRSSIPCRVQVH